VHQNQSDPLQTRRRRGAEEIWITGGLAFVQKAIDYPWLEFPILLRASALK